jgi:hypothetical protein
MNLAFTSTASDPTMRWGVRFTPYRWQQCRFCGRATSAAREPDCRPGVCLACGSRQCNSNQGRCVVCLVGIMPDWSGWRRECGYAGCHEQAVATAPRVRQVCADHLDRPTQLLTGKKVTTAEYIAQRIAVRDGSIREQFPLHRYVLMPEVQP